MGYGALGFLGISKQNSFGTATNSFDFLPIISETLVTNINQLVEEGQRGRFEEGNVREGLLTVAGDIVFEPHPIMLGHFLRGVMGQASSSAVGSATQWEFLPAQSDYDALCALPPYTIQVHRDAASAWQFTDAVINKLKLEVAGGAIVKATASVLARVSSLMAKSTPSFPAGNNWVWDTGSFSIAGAANADIEAFHFDIDNGIQGVTTLNATRAHGKYKRGGYRKFVVGATMGFEDLAQYNAFRAQTAQTLVATFTGDVTATSYNNVLKIDLPQVVYKAYPVNIGGPGRLTAAMDGHVVFNTTSNYAARITMVNTRMTY